MPTEPRAVRLGLRRGLGRTGGEGQPATPHATSHALKPERIKLQVALTGAACVAVGLGLFAWKVFGLGLPLLPSQPEGLWQVEIRVAGRGSGEAARIRSALPEPSARQLVFGEQFSSGRLRLSLRDDREKGRHALWRGEAGDFFELGIGFRVQIDEDDADPPVGSVDPPPDAILEVWGGATADLPSEDPEILAVLEGMDDLRDDDLGGRLRTLYAFVRHEMRPGRADDPLLVLRLGEGSREGRERLLATLLRAAGIPSRMVRGLELDEADTRERVWCEAYVGGRWWPMSAAERFFGSLPRNFLAMGPGRGPIVEGTSIESLEVSYESILERLSAQEVATLMRPPTGPLAWLSLHRLPAGTQSALRVLLLMPLGALLLAILRNVVGVPSYGTFMPMLIALAMRGTGLSMGLLLVGIVLGVGVVGRLVITRLRLLLVPRLSVLLSFVVLTVALLGLLGLEYEDRNFYQGILFPIVILTMLVERFAITLEEEGWPEALQRAFWSIVIAVAVYPVFRSEALEMLFLSYPELVLVVLGLLVWLGAYTGYRLTELVRFRPTDSEATR